MLTVRVYPLPTESPGSILERWGRGVLEMPFGAKILSVGMVEKNPVLWALVSLEERLEKRTIYVIPTGREIGEEFYGRRFIGTAEFCRGLMALHVWE